MVTRTLAIDGMSCGHCVARVTKTLSALPGVVVHDVNVGSARISFDPDGQTSMQQVNSALHEAGYPVKVEEVHE
jgi:copper chaperone CopZ